MEAPTVAKSLLLLTLILHLTTPISAVTTTTHHRKRPPPPRIINAEYIKTSCSSTQYPYLCYRSLSIYASKIKTDPEILAHTALNVSLAATKSTSRLMRRLSRIRSLKAREAAAVEDCVELVGDAVDELQRSMCEMVEMGGARGARFYSLMSDVQTWVSASLTDDDTCMEGFKEGRVKGSVRNIVRKHILRISHLTSNALALINSYASSKSNFP